MNRSDRRFDAQFLNIAERVHWGKMEIKGGKSSSMLFLHFPPMSLNKENNAALLGFLKELKFISN